MEQVFVHRNTETGKNLVMPTITEATDPVEVRREYIGDQLKAAAIIGGITGRMVRIETLDEYGHVVSKSPGFGHHDAYHMPTSLSQVIK